MIDVYYWTTPNGHKITMFLEEAGLDYEIIPINIGTGDQFKPEFLQIAPNNRIPAIVDHAPADGGQAISVFESGAILQYLAEKTGHFLPTELRARVQVMEWVFWQMAAFEPMAGVDDHVKGYAPAEGGLVISVFEAGAILQYLAEKTGQFLPTELRARVQVMEWVFWQMAGLGPMAGQNHHFNVYAPEPIPYAIDRYTRETSRLYGVLNKRLEGREFIVDEYSIADMACYPWIVSHERQKQDLNQFPHLKAWFERIQSRPGTQRAYEIAEKMNTGPSVSDERSRAILFGQDASSVK